MGGEGGNAQRHAQGLIKQTLQLDLQNIDPPATHTPAAIRGRGGGECIKKADVQEAGAREEQARGLPQEAMAEDQNKKKNKGKKQGAVLQEAAIPAAAPTAPFKPQGLETLCSPSLCHSHNARCGIRVYIRVRCESF